MQALRVQSVGNPEHEGDVGTRSKRDPLRAELALDVSPNGRDIDERDPGPRRLAHVVPLHVPPGAAAVDLSVLQRQSAECDEQIATLDDRRPARVPREQREEVPEDVGKNDLTGGQAVAVTLEGVAADAVEKAPELTRRVVETPGARPPVGAGEDGAVAALLDDPLELSGHETAGLVPGNGDEWLRTAFRAVRRDAVLEPPFPHHGLGNTAGVVEGVHHALRNRGRVGVLLEPVQRGQPAIAHLRAVRPPVGRGEGQSAVRFAHG